MVVFVRLLIHTALACARSLFILFVKCRNNINIQEILLTATKYVQCTLRSAEVCGIYKNSAVHIRSDKCTPRFVILYLTLMYF